MIISNGTNYFIKAEATVDAKKYLFWIKCDEDGVPDDIPFEAPPFTGDDCNMIWAVSDKLPTGYTEI